MMEESLAFTALLEFPWFARMESRAGGQVISDFLAAYRRSGELNMYRYARKCWSDGYPGRVTA